LKVAANLCFVWCASFVIASATWAQSAQPAASRGSFSRELVLAAIEPPMIVSDTSPIMFVFLILEGTFPPILAFAPMRLSVFTGRWESIYRKKFTKIWSGTSIFIRTNG